MKVNPKMPESCVKPLIGLNCDSLLEASHIERASKCSELAQFALLSSQDVLSLACRDLKHGLEMSNKTRTFARPQLSLSSARTRQWFTIYPARELHEDLIISPSWASWANYSPKDWARPGDLHCNNAAGPRHTWLNTTGVDSRAPKLTSLKSHKSPYSWDSRHYVREHSIQQIRKIPNYQNPALNPHCVSRRFCYWPPHGSPCGDTAIRRAFLKPKSDHVTPLLSFLSIPDLDLQGPIQLPF